MWRIAEHDAGGGDACRQPRCRYIRDGMIPVLAARLAAMEPIEKLLLSWR